MNMRVLLTAAVVCVIAPSAAAQGSSRVDSNALQAQLKASWVKFESDMKTGDSLSAATVFTPDAMIAYNTESRGTDAVRSYWSRMVRTYAVEQMTFVPEDFAVAGDLATDFGTVTQRYRRRAGGEPVTQRLRYAAIWKKQADGNWKLHRFIVTGAAIPPA